MHMHIPFSGGEMKQPGTAGFTLVELMVTAAIFVFMTALIVARYGSFNQGTLLTNTAYDMAMTIRLAQTYGTSVAQTTNANYNSPSSSFSNNFSSAYGIEVTGATDPQDDAGPAGTRPTQFALFQDANLNGVYDPGESVLKYYQFKGGAQVTGIQYCTGSGCTNNNTYAFVDITFKRPNPEPVIYASPSLTSNSIQQLTGGYLMLTITSADRSASHNVVIQSNGEISVI